MILLFIRYLALIIIGLLLPFLYSVLLPVTIYPVSFVLSLFSYDSVIYTSNTLFIDGNAIKMISACIATSAYYLLLVLNLATPISNTSRRIKSLSFLILSFWLLNVIRIVIFSLMAVNVASYFDVAHQLVWYIGTTILVVILWFVNVYLFKIKKTPIYSDLLRLYRKTKVRRRK